MPIEVVGVPFFETPCALGVMRENLTNIGTNSYQIKNHLQIELSVKSHDQGDENGQFWHKSASNV